MASLNGMGCYSLAAMIRIVRRGQSLSWLLKQITIEILSRLVLILTILLSTLAGTASAGSPPYAALEVDPFAAANGVTLPANYQTALVDSIARELSVEFSTIIILREAETSPNEHAVLRISGTVIQFKPAGGPRKFFSFGAGESTVTAEVRFGDAASERVLAIREFQGTVETIGRKIAKFCRSERLVEAN